MKKILVLCGDRYHTKEVVKLGFQELALENVTIQFVEDTKNILTKSFMDEFNLIIICKGNHATSSDINPWFTEGSCEVGVKELEEYVMGGKSILAIHAGLSFLKVESKEYTDFIGSSFVTHPPRCKVTVKDFMKNHPVVEGVDEFQIQDEHYEIELCGKYEDILFTTESETGGRQIGGYTKKVGEGMICALTPGHILDVWKNTSMQTVIKNAIAWCMK